MRFYKGDFVKVKNLSAYKRYGIGFITKEWEQLSGQTGMILSVEYNRGRFEYMVSDTMVKEFKFDHENYTYTAELSIPKFTEDMLELVERGE